MEYDFFSINIIPKSEALYAKAILSVALIDAFQFLYFIPTSYVVRVNGKRISHLVFKGIKLRMLSQ